MDDKALNQMKSRLLLSARDRGFFISNQQTPISLTSSWEYILDMIHRVKYKTIKGYIAFLFPSASFAFILAFLHYWYVTYFHGCFLISV